MHVELRVPLLDLVAALLALLLAFGVLGDLDERTGPLGFLVHVNILLDRSADVGLAPVVLGLLDGFPASCLVLRLEADAIFLDHQLGELLFSCLLLGEVRRLILALVFAVQLGLQPEFSFCLL